MNINKVFYQSSLSLSISFLDKLMSMVHLLLIYVYVTKRQLVYIHVTLTGVQCVFDSHFNATHSVCFSFLPLSFSESTTEIDFNL